MLNSTVASALLNPGNTNIKPGLERMQQILEKLGNPQGKYKVIHITGTNGKGSTATFIATGLIHAGYKVGKFTSPHIIKINECISINDQYINDSAIERIYFLLDKIANQYNICPSPFELLTLIMFYFMAEQDVDYLVLEAGMGGATDSTNVVDSLYSIITNVSLEHTKWLGNTLEQIALNKAGIIKNGMAVIADNTVELINAVKNKTSNYVNVLEKYQIKIKLDDESFKTNVYIRLKNNGFLIESGMTSKIRSGMTNVINFKARDNITEIFAECNDAFGAVGEFDPVPTDHFKLGLYGEFQAQNFLIAYEVLNHMGISIESIQYAAQKSFIPYRFQIMSTSPLVVFDITHNLAGVNALVKTLKNKYVKDEIVFVIAILGDKDIQGMLLALSLITNTIIFTTLKDNPRAINATELSRYAGNLFMEQYIINNPTEALDFAKSLSKRKMIIVSGSSYLFSQINLN